MEPRFVFNSSKCRFLGHSSDAKCDLYYTYDSYLKRRFIVIVYVYNDKIYHNIGYFLSNNKYIIEGVALFKIQFPHLTDKC